MIDDVTCYEWDHRNRLTAVREYASATATTPIWSVEQTYDHANRWIRKTVDGDGDTTTDRSTVFIYDGTANSPLPLGEGRG
ncbi:MAG: hypothetical protein HQ567_24860 [Candidatus Nealsonbacteria bacterium]|nr:hypothetical protein [Candidatus Nealsonbacteria bacterium]